jgi:hypothetical protein
MLTLRQAANPIGRMLAVLQVVGCSPALVPEVPPQAPPPAAFQLRSDPNSLVWGMWNAGEPMLVYAQVPAAANGLDMYFFGSAGRPGPGRCPPAFPGLCLGISGAPLVFGPVVVQNGEASYYVDIPSTVSGFVSFQAAVLRGRSWYTSNVATNTVYEPPKLYGGDVITDSLWEIDPMSGAATQIASLGFDAYGAARCQRWWYVVDSPLGSNSVLYKIDDVTLQVTPVGDMGVDSVKGLECDYQTGQLFAVTYLNELLDVDTGTGVATLIGHPGTSFLDSLSFGPDGWLYAANISTETLWRIDRYTGVGNAVGPLGFDNVSGLSHNPPSLILYGVARASGQLIQIDPATGTSVAVGSLPNTAFNSLF